MRSTLLFCFLAVFSTNYVFSHESFDIIRHKTPRQVAVRTGSIPKLGIYLDWLTKPKPDPKFKDNDTIPLMKLLDAEFYSVVNIGSPGRQFKMILDTTWSDSYVISKTCPDIVIGCAHHAKYDHDVSSTYKQNGSTIVYDEGSYRIAGFYSQDKFVVGQTTVKDQMFTEVNNITYMNIFSKADGLIGLGFKVFDYNPFFYNVLQQTNITKPVFSVYLNRNPHSKKGGSITLGAIPKKHIHVTNNVYDTITYLPIDPSSGAWKFRLDKVVLDYKGKETLFCEKGCWAYPDSTNSMIVTSKEDLAAINLKIGAMGSKYVGRYAVECAKVNILPFFHFVIAGKNFTLKGTDYVQQIRDGPTVLCLSNFIAPDAKTEQGVWILGASFLAQYFSIYDIKNKQIGFVRAA